jgi:GNAT superfamily N-acetyltransferase
MNCFAPYQFTTNDVALEPEQAFLAAQIRRLNDERSPLHRAVRTEPPRPLTLLLRDGTEELVGGLVGSTYWGWLEVETLWLHETLRGRGFGRSLLLCAEETARRRGCGAVFLTTFSFQARDFYLALGYTIVGALSDYPPGETFYWMRKLLGAAGQSAGGFPD